jgi:phosphoribosylformylglycinamidine synthase
MKFGIVTFPGSNCDYDAYHAVIDQLGEEAAYLWHKDHDLQGSDVVILPGGFSYGDYLRCGAIARFSPIMQEVAAHARRGGPVLAICNGFQIACEAGLLPGALLPNKDLRFVCRQVDLVVQTADTPFTSTCAVGDVLSIPAKHQTGCFFGDIPESQVVLRYAEGHNFNGSQDDIAGVVNEQGNVMGLMPHPEHAVDVLTGGSADGLKLFEGMARVAVA